MKQIKAEKGLESERGMDTILSREVKKNLSEDVKFKWRSEEWNSFINLKIFINLMALLNKWYFMNFNINYMYLKVVGNKHLLLLETLTDM